MSQTRLDTEEVEHIDASGTRKDTKEKTEDNPPPVISVENPTIEVTTPGAAGNKRLNTTFGRFADWFSGNGSYQLNAFLLGLLAAAKKAQNRAAHTSPNEDTVANIILDALGESIPIVINFAALCAGARRSAEMKIAEEENANAPQSRGLLDTFEIPTQITVPQSLFYNKQKATPNITKPEKWNKTVQAVKDSIKQRKWQADISDAVASNHLQKVIMVYNAALLIAEQETANPNNKKLLNDIAFWGTLGLIIVGFVFAFFRSFARTGLFHAEEASNTLHRIFMEHTANKPGNTVTDDSASESSEDEGETSANGLVERSNVSPLVARGGDPKLFSTANAMGNTINVALDPGVKTLQITFGKG